ncbi:putative late blight resistance protein homolog R1B-8 [Olea europaea var. sylvestris]|uniref:putative late blight resistance protein homolog R1B-8 n=1 Tax=Olea europaea var. sylvestris TaxID=158386 RepID=UPI000C1D616F|nr:putative late blight resistance protein homolog R1B-8 [Olea europaea var. sylvestris]
MDVGSTCFFKLLWDSTPYSEGICTASVNRALYMELDPSEITLQITVDFRIPSGDEATNVIIQLCFLSHFDNNNLLAFKHKYFFPCNRLHPFLMSSGEGETGTDCLGTEEGYYLPDEDKLFTGPIGFHIIVLEYESILSCQLGLPSTDRVDFPEPIGNSKDVEKIRHSLQQLLSRGKKLEELFTVPNQQSSSCPNEVVAAFINFLLRMVESILCFKAEYIAFHNLRTELGFLITFLGDTSMHLQPTNNVVIDIEAAVNEVGSFFYSLYFAFEVFFATRKEETPFTYSRLHSTDFEDVVNDVVSFLHSGIFDVLEDMPLQTTTEVEETEKAMADIKAMVHEIGSFIVFTKNDRVPESGIVDLALSDLLPKFELLKSKIKEHCITVSKMPIDMAPKTGVVSLFIVDSDCWSERSNCNVVNDVVSFLHSGIFDVLEDMPLQTTTEVEETEKAMADIKAMVHEIGSFIVFTKNDRVPESGIVDLALSDLLPKFELLKSKIKEHCITVSKMPIDMAPKTGVVSLFIVDSVLDDLMDLINNKSDRIVGLNDQIVMLHEELFLLGSSITSIAVQQEAEQEELIIKTRDIAFEVEYIINSFPPVWYLALRIPLLIEKIQLITMAIKEMKNDIDVVGMLEVAQYPDEHLSSQSEETPILDVIVGFKVVALEITEQLVRGTEQLQIISIFGMPGIGKTTLANKLYNDPSVVYHFYERALCVVSQTYNKKNILINILSCIRNVKQEQIAIEDEESLAEAVYKSLKGRRYLIVLDDIWDIKLWDDLKRIFPDDATGSRILFTTRNKEVSLKVSPHCVINALPFLSEDECWDLLQKKVFRGKSCPQELLDVGKKIAKKCHGLPLAVVVIAGVLANMENKEHLWQEVARNLSSHLSKNSNNYTQILELSYNQLPMHLKPCFLYFGAFKEDEEIHIQKLISLWVAEGYIKKEEQKSLEDVALECVMKLIDRSLVLVAGKKFDGSIKTCKIHDLLREMCLRIAEEKNFLKVVNINVDEPHPLPYFNEVAMYQKHHCLSIFNGENPTASLPFGPHVRSLLCGNVTVPTLVACGFKVLRVLDFCSPWINLVVVGINQLVHVRYLALSSTLPPMDSFHKLEFLVLRNRDAVEIPDVLLNMMSLRQVHFDGGAYFSESIRHRAIKDKSFQIKNNLQSISFLQIFDEADEKILRCSSNLRRLKGKVKSSHSYAFDFLNQLESLKLRSRRYMGYSSFNLISLPLNLKQLTLIRVRMAREQMELIGKLEYLVVLKLRDVSFDGRRWDTGEGEFPQLKFLKLSNVRLAEWNTTRDHFPRLQRLELRYCKHLKMIPTSLGDIPTLLMIEVYHCVEAIKESAKRIQEEQEDMGNEELKVIIFDWQSKSEAESEPEEESELEEESEEETNITDLFKIFNMAPKVSFKIQIT